MFFIQQTGDLRHKHHQFFRLLLNRRLLTKFPPTLFVFHRFQRVTDAPRIQVTHTPVDQIIYSVITAPIRRQYDFGHYVFRLSIFFMILSAH